MLLLNQNLWKHKPAKVVVLLYLKIRQLKKKMFSSGLFPGLLTVRCFGAGSIDFVETSSKSNIQGTKGVELHRMGHVLRIKRVDKALQDWSFKTWWYQVFPSISSNFSVGPNPSEDKYGSIQLLKWQWSHLQCLELVSISYTNWMTLLRDYDNS